MREMERTFHTYYEEKDFMKNKISANKLEITFTN